MHREDAYCPACPDPETAFRLEDIGMKVVHDDFTSDTITVKASRPMWEPVMLEHLRAEPDDAHRRLHDRCVTALRAAGQTAEEAARADVQSVADGVRRSMDDVLRPEPRKVAPLESEIRSFMALNSHLDDWAIEDMRPIRPVAPPEGPSM